MGSSKSPDRGAGRDNFTLSGESQTGALGRGQVSAESLFAAQCESQRSQAPHFPSRLSQLRLSLHSSLAGGRGLRAHPQLPQAGPSLVGEWVPLPARATAR